jgi:outer membrane protein assembly factor BamE (lipoprotein component of BamABCDE complex)
MLQRRLRVRIRRMMVAVAIAGIMLAVAKFLFIDNRPIDILFAAISAVGGDFTVYAKGYSESNFHSVRVGMTTAEVQDAMGPPLSRGHWVETASPSAGKVDVSASRIDNDIWYYTSAGKAGGSFWLRAVQFRNGVVHCKDRTFYMD